MSNKKTTQQPLIERIRCELGEDKVTPVSLEHLRAQGLIVHPGECFSVGGLQVSRIFYEYFKALRENKGQHLMFAVSLCDIVGKYSPILSDSLQIRKRIPKYISTNKYYLEAITPRSEEIMRDRKDVKMPDFPLACSYDLWSDHIASNISEKGRPSIRTLDLTDYKGNLGNLHSSLAHSLGGFCRSHAWPEEYNFFNRFNNINGENLMPFCTSIQPLGEFIENAEGYKALHSLVKFHANYTKRKAFEVRESSDEILMNNNDDLEIGNMVYGGSPVIRSSGSKGWHHPQIRPTPKLIREAAYNAILFAEQHLREIEDNYS